MPEVKVETSKKWTVNWTDAIRSSLTSLFTAVAAVALQALDAFITALTTSGTFTFDKVSFLLALKLAVATWIGDMIRRWLKSSRTVITVTPPIKTLDDGGNGEPGTGGSGEIPSKPPPPVP